jgi:hypothetical protein
VSWLCRLLGHRWDNYPDDRGRALRVCRRHTPALTEVVVGGIAFRLEPGELEAALQED